MRSVVRFAMENAVSKTVRKNRPTDRHTIKPRVFQIDWKFLLVSVIVGILFFAVSAAIQAQNTEIRVPVYNSTGAVVIELEFIMTGSPVAASSWDFSQAEMNAMREAAQYWVNVLKPTGTMPQQLDASGKPVYNANGTPVYQPVVVRVINDSANAGNAWATTMGTVASQLKDHYYDVTRPQGLIADGTYVSTASEAPGGYVNDPNGAHALVSIGAGWRAIVGNQSQTGRAAGDLGPVMIHELGHALGVLSGATYSIDTDTNVVSFLFDDRLMRWDFHLRDNDGNFATADQIIGYDENGGVFNMGDPNSGYGENPSHPTFVGVNSLELWYGKSYTALTNDQRKVGVPIQGYTFGGGYNYPYYPEWSINLSGTLSHIDTTNSLMSWQSYRNYNSFIEIELAMMQDIGYTDIVRRNFFGKSYYVDGDGITVQRNTANFGEWNPITGGYTKNANQSTYAIGTHLFANNLNIIQSGNILASGAGSAGVRIDGSSNKLTVDSSADIITNGVNGMGILVAYGKEHEIVHNGTITATGNGGIGVNFDFGDNLVGEERGSYYYALMPYKMYNVYEGEWDMLNYVDLAGYLPELEGALVSQFDINGTIIGSTSRTVVQNGNPIFFLGAAIHIDDTAYVEKINVMNGADLQGNILSFHNGNAYMSRALLAADSPGGPLFDEYGRWTETAWNYFPYRDKMGPLVTTLTFGYKAGMDGTSTNQADKEFNFVFTDNINSFRYRLVPPVVLPPADPADPPADPAEGLPTIAGATGTQDEFWKRVAYRDGFLDYEYGGDVSVTIYYAANGDAFADVVTPGLIDLAIKGGVTEFQGNTAYVNGLSIDRGATLTLTANATAPTDKPEIYVYSSFIPDYSISYNNQYQAYIPNNPDAPTVVSNGRISGDGAFYLGQRRFMNDPDYIRQYGIYGREKFDYAGYFRSNGILAPGANDGEKVGTLQFYSDLIMGKDHVYEATISRIRLQDKYGRDIDTSGNIIDADGNLINSAGRLIGTGYSPVYVEANDLLDVSGETTLNGTLSLYFAKGSVFAKDTTNYVLVRSGSITDGSMFTKYENNVGFLNIAPGTTRQRDGYEEMILTIVRNTTYYQDKAETYNEKSVAKAIDNSLFQSPMVSYSLADASNSVANLRDMYNQMGGSIRANSALMNLWNPSEMVFNRVGWGNGQMPTGDRGRVNWNRIAGRTNKILGQGPCAIRSGSFWADTTHTSFNAEADGNAPEYRFARTGFMVGGEWNLTPYSAMGMIAAYSDTKLKQTGDKVDSDDYDLGAYFVFAPFNEFEIKTYIGLGFQEYAMNRYVRNAGIVYDHLTGDRGINDRYQSDTKGNSFNFSFELARPLMLHPTFILRPTLGIDAQHIWQNGFSENNLEMLNNSHGSNYYALRFKKMHYERLLFRVGFSSETTGYRGGIRMRAFYVTNFGGSEYPESRQVFKTGGEDFVIRGTQLPRNYLNLGIGANLWLDGEHTTSLFFDYDSNIYSSSRKVYAHSVSAGLVLNF